MFRKLKNLFGAQDMTVGSPFVCITKYTIPLLIGNIAQLLYMTADAIVVGNFMGTLGDTALAAIGCAMPSYEIFLVVFIGIGTGASVMVSQYFGAKDYENLNLSIGNSITVIAIVSIVVTAVATPLSGSFLRLVNAPAEVAAMANTYLTILFLGSIGNAFYNCLSAIMRGMGESVFPLLVLMGAVILNIGLDIWFIAGFGMGVRGAAVATIIAQFLAAIVCLAKVMMMRDTIRIRFAMLYPVRWMTWQIVRLGGPTALSTGVQFASSLFIQALVNSMGAMIVTAITVTQRVDSFAIIPSITFQIVAMTYTGQNVGAGKMERVKRGTKTVLLMCLVFTFVMVAAMLLFGRNMLGLFTETEVIINTSMTFIRIMVPAYFAVTVNGILIGVMRGAGDALGPMWLSMAYIIVLRIPFSYILAFLSRSEVNPNGDPNTMFYAMVIAFFIGCIVTIIYYKAGKWRGKAITEQETPLPLDA